MINCFVDIYVVCVLYLHFQITNVNDWNTTFYASIAVFFSVHRVQFTQTFSENVKMLTINSICMRMRVRGFVGESLSKPPTSSSLDISLFYLCIYISLSRITDENQCHMLCHVWTVDKLIIYVKRYSIWAPTERERKVSV